MTPPPLSPEQLEERTHQVMSSLVVAPHPQNADWVMVSGPGDSALFCAAFDGKSPKAALLLDLSTRVVALAIIRAGAAPAPPEVP